MAPTARRHSPPRRPPPAATASPTLACHGTDSPPPLTATPAVTGRQSTGNPALARHGTDRPPPLTATPRRPPPAATASPTLAPPWHRQPAATISTGCKVVPSFSAYHRPHPERLLPVAGIDAVATSDENRPGEAVLERAGRFAIGYAANRDGPPISPSIWRFG